MHGIIYIYIISYLLIYYHKHSEYKLKVAHFSINALSVQAVCNHLIFIYDTSKKIINTFYFAMDILITKNMFYVTNLSVLELKYKTIKIKNCSTTIWL